MTMAAAASAPLRADDLNTLDFTKGHGTVSVVAQDARTGAVLMVAQADRQALELSLTSGTMHYTSRTRGLWRKGETSGNVQRLVALHADCDRDAVLALVEPAGPACHTGADSCFGGGIRASNELQRLDETIVRRARQDRGSPGYTRRLLDDRNLRLKKLGEEAAELTVACADNDRAGAIEEAADLFYHAMVALRAVGAGLGDIERCLEGRRNA